MLESMKKIDKKILVMMGVLVSIVIIVIVAILFVYFFRGKSLSYDKIENKMVEAAKEYYKGKDTLLPSKIGDSIEVDVAVLVSGGHIKDLSEYTKDGVTCIGKVIVGKSPNETYDYVPYLDCGEAYKTIFLYEKLKENIVTSGNGLYDMSNVVEGSINLGFDEDGYDLSSNDLLRGYIYRGDNVDNYVKFATKTYRIVKIDGNNDYMFFDSGYEGYGPYDDRYNSEFDKRVGINEYSVSRIYENLTAKYKMFKNDGVIRTKGTIKNPCIGARSVDDSSTNGSAECSTVLKDQFFSTISIYDYMNASLDDGCVSATDKECSNYNYLAFGGYWSQTPSTENSYEAFNIRKSGVRVDQASSKYDYKPVYFMSNRLVYVSGTGTKKDPYIVK